MKKAIVRFGKTLNQSKLEKAQEKVESMNNIMATDKYKVKFNPRLNMKGMNFDIDLNPRCSE
jgi:hypothetical protein